MDTYNDNTPDEEGTEESENTAFDFWSDEGAQRYNEMLDKGSTHISSGVLLSEDY